MFQISEESATKQAFEFAKIVCANPNYTAQPSEKSASDLADFIVTLQTRLKKGE